MLKEQQSREGPHSMTRSYQGPELREGRPQSDGEAHAGGDPAGGTGTGEEFAERLAWEALLEDEGGHGREGPQGGLGQSVALRVTDTPAILEGLEVTGHQGS